MANIDHIKLLTRGVEAWNDMRSTTPFVPDLSHIDIRDAQLSGANFDDAEFDGTHWSNVEANRISARKARMNGMRTSRTNFRRGDFAGAELKGTDFVSSCLRDVDMTAVGTRFLKIKHCDCRHADLSRADLEDGCHVYNSDLRGIVLAGTKVRGAEFRRVRFDAAIVEHLRSHGAAVQKIGDLVTKRDEWMDFATYLPAEHRTDFPRILYQNSVFWINDGRWDFFISHASVDKADIAEPLARALQALGLEVWYDDDSIVVGEDLNHVIHHGIAGSRFGVVVLSPAFFGRRWTEAELDAMQGHRIFIVRHKLTPDDLARLRPELGDIVTLSSEAGPTEIAQKLVDAIRKPRLTE